MSPGRRVEFAGGMCEAFDLEHLNAQAIARGLSTLVERALAEASLDPRDRGRAWS